MSEEPNGAVDLCQRFYEQFDKRNLEGVVELFADEAVVEVGAGNTGSCAAYSGIFRGHKEIREYYGHRFSGGLHISAPLRPFCGFRPNPCVFGPWVIFSGTIRDELRDGTVTYDGSFLHVWTVNVGRHRLTSLCMHFEPSGREAINTG